MGNAKLILALPTGALAFDGLEGVLDGFQLGHDHLVLGGELGDLCHCLLGLDEHVFHVCEIDSHWSSPNVG